MRNEEHNSEFDPTLARALRQVDAPRSLEMRLIAAAEKESPRTAKVLAFPQKRAWMSGAIAAGLIVGCFMAEHAYREHQRLVAEQQFETAVQVTDQALNHTREQLAKAGLQFGD